MTKRYILYWVYLNIDGTIEANEGTGIWDLVSGEAKFYFLVPMRHTQEKMQELLDKNDKAIYAQEVGIIDGRWKNRGFRLSKTSERKRK